MIQVGDMVRVNAEHTLFTGQTMKVLEIRTYQGSFFSKKKYRLDIPEHDTPASNWFDEDEIKPAGVNGADIEAMIASEQVVALKYIAIYYGVPRHGHMRCYKQTGSRTEPVTLAEPDIEKKYCSGCGKKLLP